MTIKEAMKIIPIEGNVLVVDDAPKTKTKGGLYLLSGSVRSRDMVIRGTVLATSNIPLKKKVGKRPPEVKPGDKVIYSFLAGVKGLSEKDDTNSDVFYRIIEHDSVVAKIRK